MCFNELKTICKNIIVGTFDEMKNSVDLAIAIGGDGTLLGLARQFAQYETHVIDNQGRLGFTTDLDETDIKNELGSLLLHGGNIEERDMINVNVMRQSATKTNEIFFSGLALNDAVVTGLLLVIWLN